MTMSKKFYNLLMRYFIIYFPVRIYRAWHAKKLELGAYDYKIQERMRKAAVAEFQNEQRFIADFRELVERLKKGDEVSITFSISQEVYPALKQELFERDSENRLIQNKQYSFLNIEQLQRFTYKISLKSFEELEELA